MRTSAKKFKIVKLKRIYIEKCLKLMIIYKPLHKSLNKSLQIIRSITINNKNSQKLSLCYDVDFFLNANVRGEGWSENSDTCGQEGRVKMGKNLRMSFLDGP